MTGIPRTDRWQPGPFAVPATAYVSGGRPGFQNTGAFSGWSNVMARSNPSMYFPNLGPEARPRESKTDK
jgi:hypothetical protein